MQAVASCLQMLLEKVNTEVVNDIILGFAGKGFNVIQKVMACIAHHTLDEEQTNNLVSVTKLLITKADTATIDRQLFQIQNNGFSFMWCSLTTWLENVSKPLSNRLKIEGLATLITVLLEKADACKLPLLLIEKEGDGLRLIFSYVFFTTSPLFAHEKKQYFNKFYSPWLEKLFLRVDRIQGEVLIKKTFDLLMNNTLLNLQEKQRMEGQIFAYLIGFAELTAEEKDHLSRLREERFSKVFFPVRGASKTLCSPIQNYFSLFKQRFATRSSVYSQQLGFRQGGAKVSNRNVCRIHEDCESSGNAKNSSAESRAQLELNESTPLIRGNYA